jgi:hypothetical protein
MFVGEARAYPSGVDILGDPIQASSLHPCDKPSSLFFLEDVC